MLAIDNSWVESNLESNWTMVVESVEWCRSNRPTFLDQMPQMTVILKYCFLIIVFGILIMRLIGKRYHSIKMINQIPGPPVHPWFPWLGHALIVLDLDRHQYRYGTYALIYQMVASVNKIFRTEGICKMWIGLKPLVLLYRPDDVEVILGSNSLTQKSSEYRFLNTWLGEGLVTSSKQKWRHRRKILTPAFHFRIIEDFLPIINEQSNVLIEKLHAQIAESKTIEDPIMEVDVVPIITLCMLDIICETAMGVRLKLQANSDHQYVKALYNISRIFLIRLMRPWIWPNLSFNLSKHGRLFNRSVQETKDFTMKVIKERRKEWIKCLSSEHMVDGINDIDALKKSQFFTNTKSNRLAFLDLLLQHHLVTKKLSLEDLREEVDTFMFAGHDTTSHGISWTLYMLGLHPEIQAKVRDEIDLLADQCNGDIDYLTIDDLKQLKYLECVIKEVQRIYPTAPFIGRELTEDTKINGYLIPKETTVGIFTYVLHRDPHVYKNPEKFDPDRFRPENCNGRHPFSFIPFSAGPRNCIGQKFAMNEMKIVIAKIIRNFHLKSLEPRDKLVIVGEMILRSLNGLKVAFKRRQF